MKKILFCTMAFLAACAVRADLLYWTVGDSAPDYTYAALMATQGTTAEGSAVEGPVLKSGTATVGRSDIKSYLDATGYSFYIELMDAAGSAVAVSSLLMASDAANYMEVNGVPQGTWDGGTYTAVPEPTSGLLLLLGMAGLALKRKQA